MEFSFIAFVVILIIGLFGGAVSGWIAMREIGKLRRTVLILQRQVQYLLARAGDVKTLSEAAAPQAAEAAVKVAPARAPETAAPEATAPAPSPQTVPPQAAPTSRPGTQAKGSPAPSRRAPKPKPKLDLETLLGAKGSVWIGGLALLFGAVFLLRYTIEAGLLTPIMRVSIAVVMGCVSLGLSEWMARRDLKSAAAQALSAKADIPAILAAVGMFTLFGAAYAAHALYGLLGTMAAFVIMAAIALGAMGLSLRRGPWLAAIGLIGALTVPMLVASVTPSFIGVFAYVALITAAALWVAQRQGWLWLRAAALIGATFWLTMLLGKSVDGVQFVVWTLGIIAVTALTLRDLIRAPLDKSSARWRRLAWAGVAILTALVMLAGDDWTPLSYALPILFLLGLCGLSWRGDANRMWPFMPIGGGLFSTIGVITLFPSSDTGWLLPASIIFAGLVYALSSLSVSHRIDGDNKASLLTLSSAFFVWFMLMIGVGVRGQEAWNLMEWIGFGVAGFYGVATLTQTRVAVIRGANWAAALAWLAGVVVLTVLPTQSLTLSAGLLLMIGLVLLARPGRDDLAVRLMPLWLVGGAGVAAVTALQIPTDYLSATPFLNELWLYFGLPGAIAVAGGLLLRRRREDLASQALLGGGIAFGLHLLVLLIHHAMNGGDLTASPGFEDFAVQLLAPFAALFGASWMRGGVTDWPQPDAEPQRYILPALAIAASVLSLLIFVIAQLGIYNPLFNADTVIDGHPVLNTLLLGYFVPVLLLGATALRVTGRRPVWFVRILGGLAGISWLVWTTAQIRRWAQGETIAIYAVPWDNGELYAVSAVWLLTGIALLLAGMKTGRRDLRLASAGLITLTTLKVFLIDMSALDGAFRAVSFIGLGIVLIGIGRLYQTVLARPKTEEPA